MKQTDIILLNESYVPRQEAKIDIEDRGYQFGDGIYEVIRVYGGRVFLLSEHLQRLKRSADEIQLALPLSLDELKQRLLELTDRTKLDEGIIYVQLTRGVAPRYHGFPDPAVKAQLVAYTKPMDRPLTQQQQGVKAVLVNDIRWLRCDIKTVNLLPNVLAKQKATENGAFEAIQHRNGTVTEGSSSNVFMVKKGVLHTHPPNNLILNGITRQYVIQLCSELNLRVHEQTFSVNDLLQADEVFITSTTSEIIPVIQIDKDTIGEGRPGPITQQLQQAFDQRIAELKTKIVR
ncbi:D-alanine aminotransferase [Caldalkalibacillus thermarum]|uniref:D-amino-acid transaminase n=1 Tax=Caldalkalibacillus thermarum TaxID=296745 RepID=UPI00166AAD9B|nr:D-amino-acid transaminase [Caldalkalibacillus thermarum]GGK24991.1 D-alanine aminotransferase [Caldalkalibacillus thermarum]